MAILLTVSLRVPLRASLSQALLATTEPAQAVEQHAHD
jgi:hypothetical protein